MIQIHSSLISCLLLYIMITVSQINKGKIEKATMSLLITYKCVMLACVLKLFFPAEAEIVLKF